MQNRDSSFVKYLLSLSMLLPAATATTALAAPPEPEDSATVAEGDRLAPAAVAKLDELMRDGEKLAWINWTDWEQSWSFSPSDEDTSPRPSAVNVLRDVKSEQA